jgi:hypothetical protein
VTAAGIEGWTTTIQDGATWAAEYAIEVDAAGATRSAAIRGRSGTGFCTARPGPTATATGWSTANPRPCDHVMTQGATPTSAAPLSKSTPDRRLGARDVPAMRVAGGAPITPICAVLGQLVINRPCEQNGGSARVLPRTASVTYCDGPLGPGPGRRGTARGTSAGRIRVHCVRSGQISETFVQAERAVLPSSPLLIRGKRRAAAGKVTLAAGRPMIMVIRSSGPGGGP